MKLMYSVCCTRVALTSQIVLLIHSWLAQRPEGQKAIELKMYVFTSRTDNFPSVSSHESLDRFSKEENHHMFAQNFLNFFFEIVSNVLKIKLDICPLTAIFLVPFFDKEGSVVAFASLLVWHRILLSWCEYCYIVVLPTTPFYISVV